MKRAPTRMEDQGGGPGGYEDGGTTRQTVRRGGISASLAVVGRGPVIKTSSVWASCYREWHHDVSILIGLGGRVLGVEPRSKVSMMIMRPPQHGHGSKDVGGSSAVASGSSCGGGTASSSRTRARLSVRPPLANRP